MAERVTEFVIRRGAGRIKDKTLLIVDPSDIAKPYAEKMEHLARVRDGSKKELADGYWLCQIVGAECEGQEIVPLVNHLWSQDAPGFRSENAEIRRWVKAVARATRRRGTWVVDRGATGGGSTRLFCAGGWSSWFAWWAVQAYLTRWRIEDTLRFAKQSYRLEDVRVLGYDSLQNLMAMALLAMDFTMVELGRQMRLAVLCHHAVRAAKRLFGIPEFCYYAIADGQRAICTGRQAPPFDFSREPPPDAIQLDLFALG